MVFSPSRLIKMKPAPTPSLDLEPSKYKVQIKALTMSLFTKFLHLEAYVFEKFSIYEVTTLSKKGDFCALKFPKNDSAE